MRVTARGQESPKYSLPEDIGARMATAGAQRTTALSQAGEGFSLVTGQGDDYTVTASDSYGDLEQFHPMFMADSAEWAE